MLVNKQYGKKWLHLAVGLCALFAASFTLPANAVITDELPSIGSNQPDRVTVNQEFELGRTWLRQYRASTSVIGDPIVQDYLEQLVRKLAVESNLYERRLNVVAINAKTINAFAVPGGVIGVHSALLVKASDESMVASVLAHELAHLSQRHYARRKDSAENQQMPLLTAMLAGLVLSANGQAQAGTAAILGSQAVAIQNQLQFSRQHETEADAVGFQVLSKAGFDSAGMGKMFELLQTEARTNGGSAPEFLLTHPLTESRIGFAQERAQQQNSITNFAQLDFQLVRVHSLLLQTEEAQLPAEQARLLNSVPNSLKASVSLYLDILLALHQQNAAKAKALAEQLALQPDHLYFRLLKARVLAANNEIGAAINLLQQQLSVTPENYPTKSLLAYLHLQSGQNPQAIALYQAMLKQRTEDPILWHKLSEAAKQAGDLLTVYQANAEVHQLTGNLPHAMAELKLAKEYASNDPLTHARISERLEVLQKVYKQMDKGR
ncbi:Putative Zn-dependent protease, contains TPR repeats [Oceanospirillum multiglobuliferum]|uniref:Peptidase M48 domain-containing protein n=1 Tax=Oceanospirillum multiglobuliferum TaxID=64969 RepID=A0A1T4Q1B2_9GAMM|nr:M48 family metalloprotease [Oceanospirillum multiglobuliferum]OPX55448.1 hypothetical protein BTE48_08645 [Oceanospirillum multiglobuliferum]SJZ96988.1 Putative Zn-dependent protease, contains TPR repeats [Oceanospirillum multiglobuliferum]